MLVVPDEGELVLLEWMLKSGPSDLHLHLYKNDYSPTRESTAIDFTDCDFVDYYIALLEPSNWSGPVLDDGAAQLVWGPGFITWATTGTDQYAFGYFVTTEDDATVVWAERFAAPQLVTITSPILVRPVMRLHSEVEPVP